MLSKSSRRSIATTGLDLHGSPALCMARAEFAKEKGESELAEKRYEACLERFPSEALVLSGVIDVLRRIGRPERSEAILERALELAPEASSYRIALAPGSPPRAEMDEAEALLRAGIEVASPARSRRSLGGGRLVQCGSRRPRRRDRGVRAGARARHRREPAAPARVRRCARDGEALRRGGEARRPDEGARASVGGAGTDRARARQSSRCAEAVRRGHALVAEQRRGALLRGDRRRAAR